jgi:hypothetical protein
MTRPDANGWLPIETKPKGFGYLVYQPDCQVGRNTLPARIVHADNAGYSRPSTHWQPLPKPPVPTPTQQGE